MTEGFAICETVRGPPQSAKGGSIRVISKRRLNEFWEKHPQAQTALLAWYRIAKARRWRSLADVRADFRHADSAGDWTVFNVGGNDFRLVVDIWYAGQIIYIKKVMTHAEYDKGKWK